MEAARRYLAGLPSDQRIAQQAEVERFVRWCGADRRCDRLRGQEIANYADTLTGTLTKASRWPEGDWRNHYFNRKNLMQTLKRVDALKRVVPEEMTLPELALRFILQNPAVATVIPGMRKTQHVRANTVVSDGNPLPAALMTELRGHRWDRTPAPWSD